MIHINQLIHFNHIVDTGTYDWNKTTPIILSSTNDISLRPGGKWNGIGEQYTIIDVQPGQRCYLWKGSRENFIKQLLKQKDSFQVNIIDEY